MCAIVEKYVRFYASTGKEESTVLQCEEKLNRVFRVLSEKFGVNTENDCIDGLDSRVLMDYYAWLSEGRGMATRNNYVSLLNPFLAWAYKSKRIGEDLSNVLKTYKLPSIDKTPEWERKNNYLSPDQVHQLLHETPGRNKTRDRAIIAMFLGSGFRVTELCMLTLGSVLDYPRGEVYLKRKGGEWKHAEVADYVYDYLAKYLETRADLSDHTQPLFLTTHGKPCNRNQIYKALSFKQKQLNQPTGAHSFRHTVISEAEKEGGAGVARDLANHKSLKVTNRYDHTTQQQRKNAINSLPWAKS